MTASVDTSFDFKSDTPAGKDPDSFSPTLRRYRIADAAYPASGKALGLDPAKCPRP